MLTFRSSGRVNERYLNVRRRPQQRRFRLRSILYVLAALYVALVIVGSGIGWYRLLPLRAEFMEGSDKASCKVISHDGWRELQCGGYYDEILTRRDAKAHEMGCVVLGPWHVEDNNSPYAFNVYVDMTFCWKPTLTL